MSRETTEWLNRNVLRGFTAKRGHAWHYSMAAQEGMEPNHYDGAIPVEDLYRRLFGWAAVPRKIMLESPGFVAPPIEVDGVTMDDPTAIAGWEPYSEQVAWVRNDTGEVLGVHSDTYQGHQYGQWCVKAVEGILGQGLSVANAGLLKKGAVAWVQVEMPENVTTPQGVTIRPFLLATTSFDGSIATTYKTGYTDTVCDNTREMFLREPGDVFRVKHTSKSGLRIMEAREALNLMFTMTEGYEAEIAKLCEIDVTDGQWSKFVEAHAPIAADASKRTITMAETKREELTQLWNNDNRVSPWRGTAWGVVQAVNTHVHHMGIIRNVNRVERNMLRAVKGQVGAVDKETLSTLSTVMERELIPA